MANTLSVMTNVLRNVVSKQRIRYKEKGFNLDLAYVCDNIIAMGYPAEKYESMYRNRLEDVYKFLEENHGDHYKIYNLCLERSYDINKFHGRVSVYPFEDHNPPTIELIQQFCEDVDSWLKTDALNVAAVHCKAGKGRTGTMICCYLLYSGQQRTADEALSCYDEKRTKDRKGVTIPSQRRYVQYFAKLTSLGLSYKRRSLQFCEIRFSEANTLHSQGSVHCLISVLHDKVQLLQSLTIDFRKHCILDMNTPPLIVAGDIKVELTKNNKKIFHFWFNTFFVTDSAVTEGEGNDEKYVYTLHKWEIDDAHKDKEHKCFSEDFKVELVFYVDENNIGPENVRVSSSNSLANNRSPSICAAGTRLQQTTQSNNYSLPQNSSSGSEMNFLCDQKSSSSTSVTTDNSNGYESKTQRSAQLRSCGQDISNMHHSHPYMVMHDANIAIFNSPPALPLSATKAAAVTVPPDFILEHEHQTLQTQHHHTNNVHLLQQQTKVSLATATSTPNQRHTKKQCAGGGSGGEKSIEAMCPLSAHLDATCNTTYCHSTNSSKTSSVSSQSSSAIGDNEEDWESGESSAKQLEHITLLLSTSSVNQLLPNNSTNTNQSFRDSLRSKQEINTGIHSSPSASSTRNFASPSFFSPSSQCLNNKSNTSSSCINRVADGDDDYNDANNVDDNQLKSKNPNSKIVVNKPEPPKTIAIGTMNFFSKELESNKCKQRGAIVANIEQISPKLALTAVPTAAAPSGARPKLIHLLMPQSPHKPIFRRKSSYKLGKNSTQEAGHIATITDCTNEPDALDSLEFVTPPVEPVLGSFSGVATTSKQKLKIKLKKNKLKLSQKFQWFQNYFRSDPVDFCENFVQQTTSIRRNSICSVASRTHKLSTTTPPPATGTTDGSSSCEQLNDRVAATVSVSQSTSNASIATGDLCEDYYSYICDNKLSFNNSPCKSPRSMADIISSISRSAGSSLQQSFRERRETMPSINSLNGRESNVVIVAAKPAKTNAIGFNISNPITGVDKTQQPSLAKQDSLEVESSPDSIYSTPSNNTESSNDNNGGKKTEDVSFECSPADENRQRESDSKALESEEPLDSSCNENVQTKSLKPQAKYSLNLVIECPSKSSVTIKETTVPNECHDMYSAICCDNEKNVPTSLDQFTAEQEALTTAAIMSDFEELVDTKMTDSSSSGFCTSDCCTTNSSSSSCNCNPFAVVLERHAALAAAANRIFQNEQKSHDVIEINKRDAVVNTAVVLPEQ